MTMTKLEAWEFIKEHLELGYEDDELEEVSEYVEEFEEAVRTVEHFLKQGG